MNPMCAFRSRVQEDRSQRGSSLIMAMAIMVIGMLTVVALMGYTTVSLRSASASVSYTHLRAHETPEHLVCRLLLEKKKTYTYQQDICHNTASTHVIKGQHHKMTNA